MVSVNILGDGYSNKTIGYLNIIMNCVMITSHTVIIPKQPINTNVVTTTTIVITSNTSTISKYKMVIIFLLLR